MGAPAVSFADRTNDREPEPGARAYTSGVWASEAFEGSLEEVGWEAVTLIGDVELDDAVGRSGDELHVAAAVAERIVHEVGERLLEPEPVAANRESGLAVVPDRSTRLLRAPLEPVDDGVEELR